MASWKLSYIVTNPNDLHKAMEVIARQFPNMVVHGVTPQADQTEVPKVNAEAKSPTIASVPDPPTPEQPQRKRRTVTPKSEARNGGTSWGIGDINYLLNNPGMSDAELARQLGRTTAAIQWQKNRMSKSNQRNMG
jgi:hypothetical protein